MLPAAYSVSGLAAGGYVVQASYQGFAPFHSPTIQVAAGQSKRVDIAMAIEVAQQQVVVTDETPTVNTTPAETRMRLCSRIRISMLSRTIPMSCRTS